MTLEIDPLLPETILGDLLRLRQVLTNLIHNAIKFTASGRIEVIAMRDIGNGIPSCTLRLETRVATLHLKSRNRSSKRLRKLMVRPHASLAAQA